MKRLVFVSIALCLFTVKAEESLYFPILDWETGCHGDYSSWEHERECIKNLGLTGVMSEGNEKGDYGADDTLLQKVCDPEGIKLFMAGNPCVKAYPGHYHYGNADQLLGDQGFHGKNHNWNATVGAWYKICGPYDRVDTTIQVHLHWLADSMTLHPDTFNNIAMKDHNMGYYLVCAEGPEAYCPQCNEAIESLCYWIKENDPNPDHKTWAWMCTFLWKKYPSGEYYVKDDLWDICKNLDVICVSTACLFDNNTSPENMESVQNKFSEVAASLDTMCKRLKEHEDEKKFEWHGLVQNWRWRHLCRRKIWEWDSVAYEWVPVEGQPAVDTFPSSKWNRRRCTEEEMRYLTNLVLSRGAKGITWMSYASTGVTIPPEPGPPKKDSTLPDGTIDTTFTSRENFYGLVDSIYRIPYSQEENKPEKLCWDNPPSSFQQTCYPYDWVKNINRDLRNLGPAFKAIEWDTATSVKSPWSNGEWNNGL